MKALDVVAKLTPDVMARIEARAVSRPIRTIETDVDHGSTHESTRKLDRGATLRLSVPRLRAGETGTPRAALFRRLAGEAEAQAAIWRAQLTARGHPAPGPFVPDAPRALVARLVQWLGPRRLRAVLAAMKVRGMAVYGSASAPSAGTLRRPRAAASSIGIAAWGAAATCARRCSASATGWCRTRA